MSEMPVCCIETTEIVNKFGENLDFCVRIAAHLDNGSVWRQNNTAKGQLMLKNNIEFDFIRGDDSDNLKRLNLAKVSDVFAFLQRNGVQAPKLAYIRDWAEPLGYVRYVTETKEGLRFITNVDEKPSVRYCKGKNKAYISAAGVYAMLSRLSVAENCIHREFSLQMLREIHARCIPHIEELHLLNVTMHNIHRIAQVSERVLQYRIANARDYFNLPPFGNTLNDAELAAIFVLADQFDTNKFSLMAKAARADLDGFTLAEPDKELPKVNDLDLSWLD